MKTKLFSVVILILGLFFGVRSLIFYLSPCDDSCHIERKLKQVYADEYLLFSEFSVSDIEVQGELARAIIKYETSDYAGVVLRKKNGEWKLIYQTPSDTSARRTGPITIPEDHDEDKAEKYFDSL